VWAPSVAFRQRRDGTFNIAAGGVADHDVTFESLRGLRLYLPNYWANRGLFRFRLGGPLWRDLRGKVSSAAARANTLQHDRGAGPRANASKVESSLIELKRLLPTLRDLRIKRSWAGYIDATPDMLPVIGEVPAVPGLFLATGFSGHGFGLGPVAGRLISELIRDGKPSLDLDALRFTRFAERDYGHPRSVL